MGYYLVQNKKTGEVKSVASDHIESLILTVYRKDLFEVISVKDVINETINSYGSVVIFPGVVEFKKNEVPLEAILE